MNDVWIITAVVALFGIANGLMLTATPQACLALKLSSEQLGLIGAGVPMGYALNCLICGRFLTGVRAKHVLLCGVALLIVSLLTLSQARTATACVIAQFGCGAAGGAFWPFASAWLLDHQGLGISRMRLLRHYNVAWTSGTSMGMFASGMLCQQGLIFEAIQIAAGFASVAFIAACFPRATDPQSSVSGAGEGVSEQKSRIGLALIVAAVSANLVALGTRSVLWNNYAELNHYYHFGAERMGLITALSLAGQLIAFGFGAIYEQWLGLRRIYIVIALSLAVVNLAIAYSSSLPVLLVSTSLMGVVLALSFQTCMMASIRYFSSPRAGTTFHEAIVGVGSMMPLAAGQLVKQLKAQGTEPLEALRAPFLCLATLALALLVMQLVLVGRQLTQRALNPAPVAEPAHPEV